MKKIITITVFCFLFTSFAVFAYEAKTKSLQEKEELMMKMKKQQGEFIQNVEKNKIDFEREAELLPQELKGLTKEEKEIIRNEIKNKRDELLKENESLRQDFRKNVKDLRKEFRENVRSTRDRARIGLAYGKGLRMLNRFRAAITRFDHIIGRLESRVQKIKEKGVDISSILPLIDEAKNMSSDSKIKMEELKNKYELLLSGENSNEISKEARQIAQELKIEIEKLHFKLKQIVLTIKAFASE